MSAIIFDGRAEAKKRKEELKKDVSMSINRIGVIPKLVSFYLPQDEGSALYTRIKKKAAEEVGIEFEDIEIKDKEDIKGIVEKIREHNADKSVHGILVQKPSGVNNFKTEDWTVIVSAIDPEKDIDGLSPENIGLISIGNARFLPATVKAVLVVMEAANITHQECDITIVGDTDILGKPLATYLLGQGFRVTIVNKETKDLKTATVGADVIVSATGVPDLIKKDMVKLGAVVIDVGEPRGDVAEEVREVASFLSPVPGGVGPLTVVSLLENTQIAAAYLNFMEIT
ncbi:MAG: bifunctional 5,10-methylenetetrahydrofolate dehydrogenase/5,10-methenyltetrahydrofolate cyclohydrolase [bacterium]|nr:bifunctional 5,10-methylenetetrahydrofolate dehydrogenase/5,10-methenyltetrahydrofolate cyclohydrolase [bacterium]